MVKVELVLLTCSMTEEGRQGIRERAASSVNMFSSQQFDCGWIR
jgi:hypothetical protein